MRFRWRIGWGAWSAGRTCARGTHSVGAVGPGGHLEPGSCRRGARSCTAGTQVGGRACWRTVAVLPGFHDRAKAGVEMSEWRCSRGAGQLTPQFEEGQLSA